jgi:hypothetical protein
VLPYVKIYDNELSDSFLLDPGAFTASAAEEIQFSPAHFTGFVEHDRLYVGGIHREGSFHTNCIRNLAHGKCGCGSLALAFDHIALKALDTFFIALNDLVVNGNIVPCFEFGNLFGHCKLGVYKI